VRGSRRLSEVTEGIVCREATACSADGKALVAEISLVARPGERLLLAGASGAGKSTLLDVLAGLRHLRSGTVTIDRTELSELDPGDFRTQVALVAQETFLFRGSIEENVTLGRRARGVSLDQALAAADLANLVAGLPSGVATLVEARGLSAGERQRLSIARAVYCDPAILLLDEATSALDRPSEERILGSLLAARSRRITLLVTHRLSPTLPVDRVLLLEQGRLVAEGTFEELLSTSPALRHLMEGARS
jgi:subfamily B ATP-binding cassette protein MsbA